MPFDRFWLLAGPVETFCEQAEGHLEQEVAKALHMVLDEVLKKSAPKTVGDQAYAVAVTLGVQPWSQRPYRPRRRS